jgi:nucleotide-binding universal stress UspA family protein
MIELKHILVPTDFGEASQRALDVAIDLSKKYEASITLLHTYELPAYAYEGAPPIPADFLTPIQEAAARQLDGALDKLRQQVPGAKGVLAYGVPWYQILESIKDLHADLVVMGTHGRRGLTHAVLGSVAEKTVRMSPVPVLTVRAAPTPSLRTEGIPSTTQGECAGSGSSKESCAATK